MQLDEQGDNTAEGFRVEEAERDDKYFEGKESKNETHSEMTGLMSGIRAGRPLEKLWPWWSRTE